nr:MAG TPA: hypothetical protein [Bacteriophage sp.]
MFNTDIIFSFFKFYFIYVYYPFFTHTHKGRAACMENFYLNYQL